jgi:aryl-alcohol dehydrogenase-like predicted oxidoreductase
MVSPPWPGCRALSKGELRAVGALHVEMLAWSSLATGFFAGRDTPHWDSAANRARRKRATELAGKLGVSTATVALAYVLHQPQYVLPVIGTRSEAHLEDALSANAVRLADAELEWLEQGNGRPARR